MRKIFSSVACNLDADILSACYPLFEAAKVEAIEWSFDALYKRKKIPDWFAALLHAYSRENRLIGHGVFFSLFSGRWLKEQEMWLQELKRLSKDFQFDHITEHFGFMTGSNFHNGAPLSIPYSKSTLAIGRDRLARIYDACGKPVGLENLAFSYSLNEVERHGTFLEELLEEVNGFIILDLHNLYCQLQNFSVSYEDMIALYPLHRVKEIHISGGSWEASGVEKDRIIRRDTHDDAVPEDVFSLLGKTIEKCPNLKYVVMEQLGSGLKTEESRASFRDDFLRMDKIVREKNWLPSIETINSFLPIQLFREQNPVEDEVLYHQQQELSNILETATSYEHAANMLRTSSLANSDWKIEDWAPYMIETAISIAQKWK